MGIFGKDFKLKKIPQRRGAVFMTQYFARTDEDEEFGIDFENAPFIRIAGGCFRFKEGFWFEDEDYVAGDDQGFDILLADDQPEYAILEPVKSHILMQPRQREMHVLREASHKYKIDNNILRLKIDKLLDMLSEATAEIHLQQQELSSLRSTANSAAHGPRGVGW